MGVRLSAGTLYAVIARLEAHGVIEPLESEDRRRPNRITATEARELARQSERRSRVASLATEWRQASLGWAPEQPRHERPRHEQPQGDPPGPHGARPVPAVLAGPLRRRGARADAGKRRSATWPAWPGVRARPELAARPPGPPVRPMPASLSTGLSAWSA